MLTGSLSPSPHGRGDAPAARPGAGAVDGRRPLWRSSLRSFRAMPVAVLVRARPAARPRRRRCPLHEVATFAVLCVAALVQSVTLSPSRALSFWRALSHRTVQRLHHRGIRESGLAGVSRVRDRTFAVTIAVLAFDERPGAAVLVGALLIVAAAASPSRSSRSARVTSGASASRRRCSARRCSPFGTTWCGTSPSTRTSVDGSAARCSLASLLVTSSLVAARAGSASPGLRGPLRAGCSRGRLSASRTPRCSRPSTAASCPWSRRSSRPSLCSASRSPRGSSASRRGDPPRRRGALLVVAGAVLITVFR